MTLCSDIGTDPKGLEVKTYGLESMPHVRIGDYEISMKDFRYMVEYVMTNTDLEKNDPRIDLKESITSMNLVNGYNFEGKRYGFKADRKSVV